MYIIVVKRILLCSLAVFQSDKIICYSVGLSISSANQLRHVICVYFKY